MRRRTCCKTCDAGSHPVFLRRAGGYRARIEERIARDVAADKRALQLIADGFAVGDNGIQFSVREYRI
jgi:hypothetical protein